MVTPALSARFERGVAPRAPAGAASAGGRLDADHRHPRAVRVRRPARSRVSMRSCRQRCEIVRAPAWPAARDAVGRPRRSRPARLHRPAARLPRAAGARALRRAVHHRLSGLSGAARPALKAEFGVPFVLDYQDPWVGAWGRVGRRRRRRRARLEEPRVATRSARGSSRAPSAPPTRSSPSRKGTIDGIVERMPAAARAAARA